MDLSDKSEWKDAVRLALQTAIAAAVMYVLMRALGLPEIFVGVLAAVLIVQPSLGRTFGSGMQRVLATLVGCVIGVLTVLAIPYGYGTAGALAISMLVMNLIVSFKPNWRYGVVAAVAISMSDSEGPIEAARYRSLSIGIGATIGILASLLIWPEKASTRAQRRIREAVRLLLEALKASTSDQREPDDTPAWRAEYRSLIADIDTLIDGVRIAENDHLVAQRDAVDRLAQSLVLVERHTRSRTDADDLGSQERAAIERIEEIADDLLAYLNASTSSSAAMTEDWRSRTEQLDSGVKIAESKPDQHSDEARIDFAIADLRDALLRLGDAFADAQQSDS